MQGVWDPARSEMWLDNRQCNICDVARLSRGRRVDEAIAFHIPAQRVVTLVHGWPQPFRAFRPGDPLSLRDFSEAIRLLLEHEFGGEATIFPKTKRLKEHLRNLLSEQVFGGFALEIEHYGPQKRVVLKGDSQSIAYLSWSAGQREFTPLLWGLLWLSPPDVFVVPGVVRGVQ